MSREPFELAETDRVRVRAEEIFRNEVRRSLEVPPGRASRLLRALNSPFTLWLLSTVVVAGGTAFYSQWREARSKENARVEDVSRLDMEISYRFSRVIGAAKEVSDAINRHDSLVRGLEQSKKAGKLDRASGTKQNVLAQEPGQKVQAEIKELHDDIMGRDHPLVLLSRRQGTEISPLYPEYQNFTLAGLLVELRRKVPSEHRPDIDRVLEALTDPYFDPIYNRNMRKAELLCVMTIRINESLLLERWRNVGFPYVNCPPENPFCRSYASESGQVRQSEDRSCFRVSEEERKRIEQQESEGMLFR